MVEWQESDSRTEFSIAELELVIVTGLDMSPLYTILEKLIIADDQLTRRYSLSSNSSVIRNIKLTGRKLVQILDESYEKMSSD